MSILFTSNERYLITQDVHSQALKSGIVPAPVSSVLENVSTQSKSEFLHSNISQQSNKLAELRDQKRRRAKYVNQTVKKSFYNVNSQ